eukprot:gene28583-31751_t
MLAAAGAGGVGMLAAAGAGGMGSYALNSAGVLVMMGGGARSVEKSVNLRLGSQLIHGGSRAGGVGSYAEAGAGGVGMSAASGSGGVGVYAASGAGGVGSYALGAGGVGSYEAAGAGGMGSYEASGAGGVGSYEASGAGGMGSYEASRAGGVGSYEAAGAGGEGSYAAAGAGGVGIYAASGAGGVGSYASGAGGVGSYAASGAGGVGSYEAVRKAFSLAVSSTSIACACAEGVVRLFSPRTLAFKANLPRPTSRGQDLDTSIAAPSAQAKDAGRAHRRSSGNGEPTAATESEFPDTLAVSFISSGEHLAAMYSDHSLYFWDVRKLDQITALRCLSSHSGSIWDAALLPSPEPPSAGVGPYGQGSIWDAALLPSHKPPSAGVGPFGQGQGTPTAIVTCSSDGTLRLWNLNSGGIHHRGNSPLPGVRATWQKDDSTAFNYAQGAQTLKGVMYASQLDKMGAAGAGGAGGLGPLPLARRPSHPSSPLPRPPSAAKAAPASVLLRCLRISPDGRHLATGDRQGNIRVYCLSSMELLTIKEAHDAEVLSLDYSIQGFLASGSRDAAIHVFDSHADYSLVNTRDAAIHVSDSHADYSLVNTLDEHTAAVTSLRYSPNGDRLFSCSVDRSLIFRDVLDQSDCTLGGFHREVVPKGILDVLYQSDCSTLAEFHHELVPTGILDVLDQSDCSQGEFHREVVPKGILDVLYQSDCSTLAEFHHELVPTGILDVLDQSDCSQGEFHREVVPKGILDVLDQSDCTLGEFHREVVPKGILYDLAVDPIGSIVVTVGQDGAVRVFDAYNGQQKSVVQQSPSAGYAVHVTLDPSGTLAMCSCADGALSIYDLMKHALLHTQQQAPEVSGDTGELVAKGYGHGEMATAMVSVGGDGCVIKWRLPDIITQRVKQGQKWLDHIRAQQPSESVATPREEESSSHAEQPKRRGQKWLDHIRAQQSSESVSTPQEEESPSHAEQPKRRAWASVDSPAKDPYSTMERVEKGLPLQTKDALPDWAQLPQWARGAVHSAHEEEPQDHSSVQSPPLPHSAGRWATSPAAKALVKRISDSSIAQPGGACSNADAATPLLAQRLFSSDGQGPHHSITPEPGADWIHDQEDEAHLALCKTEHDGTTHFDVLHEEENASTSLDFDSSPSGSRVDGNQTTPRSDADARMDVNVDQPPDLQRDLLRDDISHIQDNLTSSFALGDGSNALPMGWKSNGGEKDSVGQRGSAEADVVDKRSVNRAIRVSGRMEGDLAKMRERLLGLQQQFHDQVQQRPSNRRENAVASLHASPLQRSHNPDSTRPSTASARVSEASTPAAAVATATAPRRSSASPRVSEASTPAAVIVAAAAPRKSLVSPRVSGASASSVAAPRRSSASPRVSEASTSAAAAPRRSSASPRVSDEPIAAAAAAAMPRRSSASPKVSEASPHAAAAAGTAAPRRSSASPRVSEASPHAAAPRPSTAAPMSVCKEAAVIIKPPGQPQRLPLGVSREASGGPRTQDRSFRQGTSMSSEDATRAGLGKLGMQELQQEQQTPADRQEKEQEREQQTPADLQGASAGDPSTRGDQPGGPAFNYRNDQPGNDQPGRPAFNYQNDQPGRPAINYRNDQPGNEQPGGLAFNYPNEIYGSQTPTQTPPASGRLMAPAGPGNVEGDAGRGVPPLSATGGQEGGKGEPAGHGSDSSLAAMYSQQQTSGKVRGLPAGTRCVAADLRGGSGLAGRDQGRSSRRWGRIGACR